MGVKFTLVSRVRCPRLPCATPHPILSPEACLREAASAKAGERGRVRGRLGVWILWVQNL